MALRWPCARVCFLTTSVAIGTLTQMGNVFQTQPFQNQRPYPTARTYSPFAMLSPVERALWLSSANSVEAPASGIIWVGNKNTIASSSVDSLAWRFQFCFFWYFIWDGHPRMFCYVLLATWRKRSRLLKISTEFVSKRFRNFKLYFDSNARGTKVSVSIYVPPNKPEWNNCYGRKWLNFEVRWMNSWNSCNN